jgi:hypothetical protein
VGSRSTYPRIPDRYHTYCEMIEVCVSMELVVCYANAETFFAST